jgi:4-alpha-glucanotransferase
MGYFYPAYTLSREELNQAGFDDGRISWLAEPHIRGEVLREQFGDEAEAVIDLALDQVGSEDLYKFGGKIAGERELVALDLSGEATEKLRNLYWDRALIRTGADSYFPAWEYKSCSRLAEFPDHERKAFDALVEKVNRVSEKMWEEQGRQLLSFMSNTVPMLPCAEDLGVIPESVPRTLSDLGILGLRVPRWAREWHQPEQPYIPVEDYPFLTVCAPSVHDTSTVREWWEREDEANGFWSALGLSGKVPATFTPKTAEKVYQRIARTNAAILVFQLQDFFAFDASLVPSDPAEERINIPGTSNEFNWTYRIPVTLSQLRENDAVNGGVQGVTAHRIHKEVPRPVQSP